VATDQLVEDKDSLLEEVEERRRPNDQLAEEEDSLLEEWQRPNDQLAEQEEEEQRATDQLAEEEDSLPERRSRGPLTSWRRKNTCCCRGM
jgi:hypothetical protein